jgi:hypothetical protein
LGWVDEDDGGTVYVTSTINDVDEVVEGMIGMRCCAWVDNPGVSRLPETALIA